MIFQEAYAIDIYEKMFNKLDGLVQQRGIINIRTFLPRQNWNQPYSINYAHSFPVFQHIVNIAAIDSYIRMTAYALKRGGILKFQFDTRPQTFLCKPRKNIPDPLLPKTYRSGIRRILRNYKELVHLFNNSGLKVIDALKEDTENYIFLLQKP